MYELTRARLAAIIDKRKGVAGQHDVRRSFVSRFAKLEHGRARTCTRHVIVGHRTGIRNCESCDTLARYLRFEIAHVSRPQLRRQLIVVGAASGCAIAELFRRDLRFPSVIAGGMVPPRARGCAGWKGEGGSRRNRSVLTPRLTRSDSGK